jgi:hypothetical protein
MALSHKNLEPHKKYLASVPPEVVRRRLGMFRLKPEVMEALPIICLNLEIDPKVEIWKEWLHPIDPVSLDDLKNWFGVPNEVARKQMSETCSLSAGGRQGALKRVHVAHLPTTQSYNFGRLDHKEKVAVRQMANNLLSGYVDRDEVERPQTRGVINYMLERIKRTNPKVFVAPDLIVCPDDNIVFKNLPALVFNNILIYGGGRITTNGHTKIHAYQIRHVNA